MTTQTLFKSIYESLITTKAHLQYSHTEDKTCTMWPGLFRISYFINIKIGSIVIHSVS